MFPTLPGGEETACAGPGSAADLRPAAGASCPRAGDDAPRGLGFETASYALEGAAHTMREGKSSKNGPVPAEGDSMGPQQQQDAVVNSKRGGTRPIRSWSMEQRLQHRIACKSKSKLSLGQKLEIVAQHQSRDPAIRKTQAQLAILYGKSRSAISKILRPENISKLKDISATGVHKGVKRYSHVLPHLELEKKIHNMMVERTGGHLSLCPGRRGEVMAFAQEVAEQAGVTDFRATYGWYTRFLKRHGLIETFDGVGVDSAEMIAQEDELEELEDEDADAGEEEDMSEDDDDAGDAAHESAAQKGGASWNLMEAVRAGAAGSAFNTFHRESKSKGDALELERRASRARTSEQGQPAFGREEPPICASPVARAMASATVAAAAAAAAATAASYKHAAAKAGGAGGWSTLESWLWGLQAPSISASIAIASERKAATDQALYRELQAIDDVYQRDLQRAHETYKREVQLQEQAYNASAAASAILNLHNLARANNLSVNLDLLGLDPSALAGLGIPTSEPLQSHYTAALTYGGGSGGLQGLRSAGATSSTSSFPQKPQKLQEAQPSKRVSVARYGGPGWSSSEISKPGWSSSDVSRRSPTNSLPTNSLSTNSVERIKALEPLKDNALLGLGRVGAPVLHQDGRQGDAHDPEAMKFPPLFESLESLVSSRLAGLSRLNQTSQDVSSLPSFLRGSGPQASMTPLRDTLSRNT